MKRSWSRKSRVDEPLTPQRQKVFDFVRSQPEFPTSQDIADYMGWKSTASANQVLRELRGHGLLTLVGVVGKSYVWQLAQQPAKAKETVK